MSTQHYTAVFEHEENGTVSAWIVGLPGVFAAADSVAGAKEAIRDALDAHLAALRALKQSTVPRSEIQVLRQRGEELTYVGLGALLGKTRSRAKTRAARVNGRKGGRPSKAAAANLRHR